MRCGLVIKDSSEYVEQALVLAKDLIQIPALKEHWFCLKYCIKAESVL